MNDEDSRIRHLKRRWDEEDAARDERERLAKLAFLEQEANELFAPIENHLTRLGRVLHAANAAVEVDPTWEHLGEQKLHRTAKVIFGGTAEYLPLDFTIEGITIFYHDRRSCLLLCIFFQYPSVVIGDVRSSNSFMRLL